MCTLKAQPVVSEVFPVTIDLSRSLEEMVAVARFKHVRDSSWKKFPFNRFSCARGGLIDVGLVLVDFHGEATVLNATDELRCLDLEPARLEHLLAFDLKYPDIKNDHDIVALGHPELRAAPIIFVRNNEATLLLESLEGPWIRFSDMIIFSGSVDDPPERHWDKKWENWKRFLALSKATA